MSVQMVYCETPGIMEVGPASNVHLIPQPLTLYPVHTNAPHRRKESTCWGVYTLLSGSLRRNECRLIYTIYDIYVNNWFYS